MQWWNWKLLKSGRSHSYFSEKCFNISQYVECQKHQDLILVALLCLASFRNKKKQKIIRDIVLIIPIQVETTTSFRVKHCPFGKINTMHMNENKFISNRKHHGKCLNPFYFSKNFLHQSKNNYSRTFCEAFSTYISL